MYKSFYIYYVLMDVVALCMGFGTISVICNCAKSAIYNNIIIKVILTYNY